MSKYYDSAFARVVRKLRTEIPLGVPVRIQTADKIPGDAFADCTPYFAGDDLVAFRIRVKRGQPIDSAVDCLIHEYAHALDRILQPNNRLDHRESWGRCYAKCYQAVLGKH